jgi:competence protein ComEA
MDFESLKTKLASVLKKYWLPISIGVLGLTLLVYGLIYLSASSSKTTKDDSITFETGENTSTNSVKKIMVDVEGAVVNPGVYSVGEDARVQDGLIAAGGFSVKADRNWIAKNLNLAAKLSDSTKIYIPDIDEDKSTATGANSSVAGISSSDVNVNALININTATSGELDALPGIGPVTAEKIINNRPYSTIDDLLSKKAVSNKVFLQIKNKIAVY